MRYIFISVKSDWHSVNIKISLWVLFGLLLCSSDGLSIFSSTFAAAVCGALACNRCCCALAFSLFRNRLADIKILPSNPFRFAARLRSFTACTFHRTSDYTGLVVRCHARQGSEIFCECLSF